MHSWCFFLTNPLSLQMTLPVKNVSSLVHTMKHC